MKKIKKTIKAIFLIIKNPWLLNKVLNTPSVWNEYVKTNYNFDNGLPVISFYELFDNPEETIFPYSFADGGSLPTDLFLLKSLARKFYNCKYFEIGTWRGESAVNVASVAKECYSLNLSENEMEKLSLKKEYIEQIGMYSKNIKNITHIKGNSLNFDFSSLNKKFDLIFIDGEHHYDYVLNDTKKVFANLLHQNSIVVWHDYAFTPEEVRNQVLAGILDGTPKEFHKFLYHVEGTKSAIFIREKIKAKKLKSMPAPEYTYEVKLKIK